MVLSGVTPWWTNPPNIYLLRCIDVCCRISSLYYLIIWKYINDNPEVDKRMVFSRIFQVYPSLVLIFGEIPILSTPFRCNGIFLLGVLPGSGHARYLSPVPTCYLNLFIYFFFTCIHTVTYIL